MKVKIHIIDFSNCTFILKRFSLDLIPCFWPIFVDFQNEASGLCTNNLINKDVKGTFMVS